MRPWLGFAATLALAACQAAPGGIGAASPEPTDGLAAIPPCADGLSATLSTGAEVAFMGAAPERPETCLRRMNGRTYRYVLGFWEDGRSGDEAGARAALRQVLTGPVGTKASFVLRPNSTLALWRSVTVTHLRDPNLPVAGTPHPTLLLKVVRQGGTGREDVAAETLFWLDRATLIPLKREDVVRMDRGAERELAWRVRALTPTPN
ncbi:MAG: hypothetical protein KGI51_00965 [Rhodospirillales bacterium]|nr:hypothetical protein [Rhodospirillales bacterium]